MKERVLAPKSIPRSESKAIRIVDERKINIDKFKNLFLYFHSQLKCFLELARTNEVQFIIPLKTVPFTRINGIFKALMYKLNLELTAYCINKILN